MKKLTKTEQLIEKALGWIALAAIIFMIVKDYSK